MAKDCIYKPKPKLIKGGLSKKKAKFKVNLM